jgi:hypothetical protein
MIPLSDDSRLARKRQGIGYAGVIRSLVYDGGADGPWLPRKTPRVFAKTG